jgi:predicted dehydrogenase
MRNTLYPMARALPMRFAAACDINPQNLEKFAAFYCARKLTWTFRKCLQKRGWMQSYARQTRKLTTSYKACLHVFVEKTPCETAAQARELAELSKMAGKVVAVGFNIRYATAYTLAKDINWRATWNIFHSARLERQLAAWGLAGLRNYLHEYDPESAVCGRRGKSGA